MALWAASAMQPTFVVLTDLSEPVEVALKYATRLASELAGQLVLLNVYQDPLLEPESAMMTMPLVMESRQQVKAALAQRAKLLPVPAEVVVSTESLEATITELVHRYHPLAFVLGREHPETLLDRLLPHQAAPVLQAACYPVLLVPDCWRDTQLPSRLAVAADEDTFWLTTPSMALGTLMARLRPTTTVVHVAPHDGPSHAEVGLQSVRRTCLFGVLTNNSLYEVRGESPVDGILHAADELHADMLVVMARPHTFLGGLFHRSVTARLLRCSSRPVLVLPTTN
ncbi:universal stress protein [Hymenobacter wooponensis]|uniref:Universal stress protein n=1 Tax=Hymenobacter wooponensis TaxID=1525360 RepID=A0A4Z0MH00_9BACT|nr:universal stress protein [Hymenobacter wooponensis]TGD78786.1 universal stress protein [Hymenobacter wooponensis]